jgi:hypothetical protein
MTTPQERQDILAEARATLVGKLDADDSRLDKSQNETFVKDAADPLARWSALRRSRQEPETPRDAAPEPVPVDWSAWGTWVENRIQAAIERERAWWIDEALPELVALIQAEAAAALAYEKRSLLLEIGELRLALGEAKLAMNATAQSR